MPKPSAQYSSAQSLSYVPPITGIAAWTRNKTPINIQKWVENEGTPIFVAVGEGGDIAGVGAVETSGRILLNYVDPAFRRHGVSKALLMWMENFLLECGVATATLTATETALVFYQRAGWERSGPREEDFGFPGYPMRKHLNANDSRG